MRWRSSVWCRITIVAKGERKLRENVTGFQQQESIIYGWECIMAWYKWCIIYRYSVKAITSFLWPTEIYGLRWGRFVLLLQHDNDHDTWDTLHASFLFKVLYKNCTFDLQMKDKGVRISDSTTYIHLYILRCQSALTDVARFPYPAWSGQYEGPLEENSWHGIGWTQDCYGTE